MPIFNALPYLDSAVKSILAQTFVDFELIMLDDGSTDGSGEAAGAWEARDTRIRVLRNATTTGLACSSNRVVSNARGNLIARMDADDLSQPTRLLRQVDILAERPNAVLVGALATGIDGQGRTIRSRDRSRLRQSDIFSPFPHGSVMFRRNAFELAGGYRDECDG